MAITISGSGITSANIADGTIVNGDIHPGAAISGSKLTGVTPTKSAIEGLGIAASSITGALPAIDGSALTGMSAGKVLQAVVGVDATQATLLYTNTWTEADATLRTAITLKSTNPIIHITWICNPETDSTSNDREFAAFKYNVNGAGYNSFFGGSHCLSLDVSHPQTGNSNIVQALQLTANAGDVVTFTPYVITEGSTGASLEFGQNFATPGAENRMFIMEIGV